MGRRNARLPTNPVLPFRTGWWLAPWRPGCEHTGTGRPAGRPVLM